MAYSSSVSQQRPCVERMPTQAPLGYHTPQALAIPHGLTSNPLLSQEFYRATSNLGTAIVEPQQVPPQQHPAGNLCPDPEIESTVANMYRHKQASTDSNNDPRWGHSLSHPLSLHYATLEPITVHQVPQDQEEDRRPETQGSRPLLIGYRMLL